VIATNPIFAAEAVAHRLAWAGLPADFSHYALVTHMDNMHFTKPHPQYYEEILGRLSIASEEAVMIGDDWKNDIVPAEQAGLNTYWVHDGHAQSGPGGANPDGEGTLSDFALQVREQGWLNTLTPRLLVPAMIVPRLQGNVAALFGLLREVKPRCWDQHPAPEEWSPLEAICHLLDSERLVQRPRLERIASEDNPFIAAPTAPPGPGQFACERVDPGGGAQRFAEERRETIAFLERLPSSAWRRPARHSIFGPTTLLEMANFTAKHDRLHLEQICQTAGRCT
jgi:hypothetical protein